jgi:aspartyl-tRNA(Asn)/glutamyl-tRNA(Gln) amidotransferase subunit C
MFAIAGGIGVAIDIKEVEHIALLARINISEKEKAEFAEQMTQILQYVEKLNELNTNEVEPLYHILPIYNVFREDNVVESPDRDELFANAPQHEDGYYKVPRIL